MKTEQWIETKDRLPKLGGHYFCKVDTKRDSIEMAIVEYAKYPNGNCDWDIGGSSSIEKFGVDAEVVLWLDEDAQQFQKQEPEMKLKEKPIDVLIRICNCKDGGVLESVNVGQAIKAMEEYAEQKKEPICIQTGIPCGYPCYDKCPLYNEQEQPNRQVSDEGRITVYSQKLHDDLFDGDDCGKDCSDLRIIKRAFSKFSSFQNNKAEAVEDTAIKFHEWMEDGNKLFWDNQLARTHGLKECYQLFLNQKQTEK